MRGRMIEDKTIGQSHRRFSKLHPHRQRFERRNPCDPTDAGHLDERLETVSAGQGRGSLGSARTMRLRGRCDTIRVGVVGCGLFATPNSLKSHKRQKKLSPLAQHSCHNAKVVHAFEANTPFEKLPGTQITYRG